MALYAAISPLVEANQWFRNGDHPDDRTINRINTGRVVGRSKTYKTDKADYVCDQCGKPSGNHGVLGDNFVCPGDYIITHYNPNGTKQGYSVQRKHVFESRYELYKGPIPE